MNHVPERRRDPVELCMHQSKLLDEAFQEMRERLNEQERKQMERRFTGEPITQLGEFA